MSRCSKRGLLVVLAAATLSLLGCQERGGQLGGSLGQIYRLDFTETRTRLYDEYMSVEYVAPGKIVPVRISMDRRVVQLGKGKFDLTQGGEIAGRLRNGVEIPRFSTGSITFTSYGENQGSDVDGEFAATFDIDERSFGLEGKFVSKLEVIAVPAPAGARPSSSTPADAGAGDATP